MTNQYPMLKDVNKPTEREIKASIRTYLNALGIFNWPQWQGQMSVRGVPDLIGILPGSGRIVGIEVKRPGGKLRQEQEKFIENIRHSGGVAFVATSVDDVARELQIKGGK